MGIPILLQLPNRKYPVSSFVYRNYRNYVPYLQYAQPAGLAVAVGAGNYATRKTRQKPVVALQNVGKGIIHTKNNIVNKYPMASTKRSYAKKAYRRKAKKAYRKKKSKTLHLTKSIAPRTKVICVRSTDRRQLSSTSGAFGSETYHLNNFSDPWGGSGAQQGLFHDQVKALYRSCAVIGAKVTAQVYHSSGAIATHVGLFSKPYDLTTTPNTSEWVIESMRGSTRLLTPDIDKTTMIIKGSTKRHFHVSNVNDNAELTQDLENEVAPTKLWEAVFWCQSIDQGTTSVVEAMVTIEQIVLLKDPIIPARS